MLCVRLWPEEVTAPPLGGFFIYTVCVWVPGFSIRPHAALKLSHSDIFPSSSTLSFSFYVPLYRFIDPRLGAQTLFET